MAASIARTAVHRRRRHRVLLGGDLTRRQLDGVGRWFQRLRPRGAGVGELVPGRALQAGVAAVALVVPVAAVEVVEEEEDEEDEDGGSDCRAGYDGWGAGFGVVVGGCCARLGRVAR